LCSILRSVFRWNPYSCNQPAISTWVQQQIPSVLQQPVRSGNMHKQQLVMEPHQAEQTIKSSIGTTVACAVLFSKLRIAQSQMHTHSTTSTKSVTRSRKQSQLERVDTRIPPANPKKLCPVGPEKENPNCLFIWSSTEEDDQRQNTQRQALETPTADASGCGRNTSSAVFMQNGTAVACKMEQLWRPKNVIKTGSCNSRNCLICDQESR